MSIEIIDLTNTPDSPPSTPKSSPNAPTIFNFVPVSLNPNFNRNINHHQYQTTLLVPPAPIHPYETPQLATGWLQPGMQHCRVTTALIPLPESNTVELSNGVRLRAPWSQFENKNSSSAEKTLTLLPEPAPYHQVATIYRGETSSSNNNYGMVEMMKDGASTSMTLPNADFANRKVDLELRLGLY